MGFFNRKKTSSVASDVYRQAYEREHVRQAEAKGTRDAQARGGRTNFERTVDFIKARAAAPKKGGKRWEPNWEAFGGGSDQPRKGKRRDNGIW